MRRFATILCFFQPLRSESIMKDFNPHAFLLQHLPCLCVYVWNIRMCNAFNAWIEWEWWIFLSLQTKNNLLNSRNMTNTWIIVIVVVVILALHRHGEIQLHWWNSAATARMRLPISTCSSSSVTIWSLQMVERWKVMPRMRRRPCRNDGGAQCHVCQTIDDKIAAESQVSQLLSGLKVAVEAYPDLKANQNFMQLQEEVADIENNWLRSPLFQFGEGIQQCCWNLPSNIIAGMFHFNREVMFDLGESRTRKLLKSASKWNM